MPIDQILGQVDDRFDIKNIGADLLANLARGLYSPAEVVREYIQNAVDAHRVWEHSVSGERPEGPVQIEILEDNLTIVDYGSGMDERLIRLVKDISKSPKPLMDLELTGHKGVGIWAGLSYFDTLTIYSSILNSTSGYRMVIDFRKIADLLHSEEVHSLDVGEVLNPHYRIDKYEADRDAHGTTIRLTGPTIASDFFLDPESIANAVRERCPCQLDATFALFNSAQAFYQENGVETFPIEVNGVPVRRSFPSNVEDFRTEVIEVNDRKVAVFWKAVHINNTILVPEGTQLVGLRLYQTGFQIGDHNPYSRQHVGEGYPDIKLAQTYPNWYIGEFHTVSRSLKPKSDRQ